MCGCAIQVQVTTMTVSLPKNIIGIEGGFSRCYHEELPRLAHPKGCCNICYIKAVGMRYGQTQIIYGPTGHAIGGTAQQALLSFYHR